MKNFISSSTLVFVALRIPKSHLLPPSTKTQDLPDFLEDFTDASNLHIKYFKYLILEYIGYVIKTGYAINRKNSSIVFPKKLQLRLMF